ncbi:MAG: beta-ketoacyl synthase N-terminal-like domain-containing protein [Proteobacteria bacterium]|nr:beta-ketoacyl synthase N-terminal-like domain-containing protein [Pseudomonadota bacterium]
MLKTSVDYHKPRVFIHQIAQISAAGDDLTSGYHGLLLGQYHLKDVHDYSGKLLGVGYGYSPVTTKNIAALQNIKEWRHSDDTVRALYVVSQQLNLDGLSREDRQNTGVIVGSSRGASALLEQTISAYYQPKPPADQKAPFFTQFTIRSHTSPNTTSSATSSFLAQKLRLGGGHFSLASACTSSLQSIGIGFKLLRCNMMSHALCGGVEAPLTPYVWQILKKAGVLSTKNGSPPLMAFGQNRSGMVPGEGAGLVLLSRREEPKATAEIIGYGSATEHAGSVGITRHAQGLQKAINIALNEAGISAEQIDVLTIHGSGTRQGDGAEIMAIKEIFACFSGKVSLLISPWATGHTLGASGVLKLGWSIEALKQHGKLPTPPYELDQKISGFRPLGLGKATYSCILGLGFGGSAAALVIKKINL